MVMQWMALFAAAALALFATQRLAAKRLPLLLLLLLGYGLALVQGGLGLPALAAFALLLMAAVALRQDDRPALRYSAHVLLLVMAVLLSLHWFPGFHNTRVIGPVRFTPDALVYTMYLNLDKPLTGFCLLLLFPWLRAWRSGRTVLRVSVQAWLLTTLVCLGAAMALGVLQWAPKWPAQTWLWALNNLLLVTLTEEILFRGYIQGGLQRLLQGRRHGALLAWLAASLFFALVHAPAGWHWAVIAGLAGLGYGWAYRHGGLQAAVAAHFGLNLLHFTLFTYPMLALA